MARWCLDMQTGQPRHFPEGTYRAQVATAEGRLELEMMRLMWRIVRLEQSDMAQWSPDGDEMRLLAWLETDG